MINEIQICILFEDGAARNNTKKSERAFGALEFSTPEQRLIQSPLAAQYAPSDAMHDWRRSTLKASPVMQQTPRKARGKRCRHFTIEMDSNAANTKKLERCPAMSHRHRPRQANKVSTTPPLPPEHQSAAQQTPVSTRYAKGDMMQNTVGGACVRPNLIWLDQYQKTCENLK